MPIPSKESGQGVVEYALILILVVIILFVVYKLLGPALGEWWSEFIESIRSEVIYLVA